jgi:BirA family transcriptional regulator, biotin operon repressor / biotin---[acetyl-CoA-carboxylase] ligase
VICTVPETGSTSADLAARLKDGEYLPEGKWLVADRQTAGRGRQGREWFDGHGNFMGSTLVHRRSGDPPMHTLALVAGLALYEAVAPQLDDNAKAQLKWPNDLMIGSAKLAGILLESCADAVIVGIGVNLVSSPALPDRQTIALRDVGDAPDRDAFAASLAAQFDTELQRWRSYGLQPIISRWLLCAHPAGTALAVGEPSGQSVAGTFAGLDPSGSLQLRLADGAMRVIHAGEVSLAHAGA